MDIRINFPATNADKKEEGKGSMRVRGNTEKSGKDKFQRVTLTSHLSYFNTNKKKNNKKDSLSKIDKLKYFMHKLVDNMYFHIIILTLAVFSLFNDDVRLLAVPKSADILFHHLNETVFFIFLGEFLIMCFVKKKFFGSFYFYLDLISIISLLPEVHLIWDPLMTLLVGPTYLFSLNKIKNYRSPV
jgi:hypothetical protein